MAKIVKIRYAYDSASPSPQQPVKETITFIIAGTEGVTLDDPRVVEIEGVLCLFQSVSSPLYEVPNLPVRMIPGQKSLDPSTREVVEEDIPGEVIVDENYLSSPMWDPLSLPVKTGFIEIDYDAYWSMLSDHAKMVKTAKSR